MEYIRLNADINFLWVFFFSRFCGFYHQRHWCLYLKLRFVEGKSCHKGTDGIYTKVNLDKFSSGFSLFSGFSRFLSSEALVILLKIFWFLLKKDFVIRGSDKIY